MLIGTISYVIVHLVIVMYEGEHILNKNFEL